MFVLKLQLICYASYLMQNCIFKKYVTKPNFSVEIDFNKLVDFLSNREFDQMTFSDLDKIFL